MADAAPRHGLALRLLHWITACLVAAQFGLALANIVLYEQRPVLAETLVQAHITLGAVTFVVVVARIAVRLLIPAQKAPSLDTGFPFLAATVHALLYACLLVMPIFGYLRLAALGFELTVFGVMALPTMELDIWLARSAAALHLLGASALLSVLALHVLGAVLHRRLFGSNALDRMRIGLRAGTRERR